MDLSGVPLIHDERLDTKNDSEQKLCVCMVGCTKLHTLIRRIKPKKSEAMRGDQKTNQVICILEQEGFLQHL